MKRALLLWVCWLSLVSLGWTAETEERYCLESPGLFFDVRLRTQTWSEEGNPQGPFELYGHVHDLTLPEDDACYVRFLQGSGRILPATEDTPPVADFTIVAHDPVCEQLIARVAGRLDADPIVYQGYSRSLVRVYGLYAQLVSCEEHP